MNRSVNALNVMRITITGVIHTQKSMVANGLGMFVMHVCMNTLVPSYVLELSIKYIKFIFIPIV